MDPRDALKQTLEVFHITATELAERSGIDRHRISKYINKKKDMNSLNQHRLINALPAQARFFYGSLALSDLKTGEATREYRVEPPEDSED
jgi:plasmid maintenance system antidote protein VapI